MTWQSLLPGSRELLFTSTTISLLSQKSESGERRVDPVELKHLGEFYDRPIPPESQMPLDCFYVYLVPGVAKARLS